MKKYVKKIVLIHTARTWERLRLLQPNEEMPFDNIGSTDEIVEISEKIMKDKIIKGFIKTKNKSDYFERKTNELSDTYIENLAEKLIFEIYIK